MSITAAKYVSSIQSLTIPASVKNIAGQTTHMLYSDGETAGAVACLYLKNGTSVYLWSDGTVNYRGPATPDQRSAIATWIATLQKGGRKE